MIQIKNKFTQKIIHQGDFDTLKECVEDAVRNGISLAFADLHGVNLSGANLWCANLSDADLSDADLSDADLRDADLRDANLSDADLSDADLSDADLRDADLRDANLDGANLDGANLDGAKMPDKPVILPPVGEAVIGYKKLRYGVVIKVEIPADADRVSTWRNRKCRASALRVLEVVSFGHGRCEQTGLPHNPNNIPTDHMSGWRNPTFVYRLGELHRPDRFNPDERDDCRPGLHFFLTLEEAEEW